MYSKTVVSLSTLVLSLLLSGVAACHDVWLEPDRFVLAEGDTVTVRQLAAATLKKDEVEIELLWRMTPRFDLITNDGSVNLLKELPDLRTLPVVKPVLKRKLPFSGPALLAMDHAFIHHEMKREKFFEYLDHEQFAREQFVDGIGDRQIQTERYARTLKCLVQVGDLANGNLHKKAIGQKLEILLLQNPYRLDPGDGLEVRVLFDGKPLNDMLVMAFNADQERLIATSSARTDARGIARFKLDRAGFWLIHMIHLYPCADPDVDWESYWASYSFALD